MLSLLACQICAFDNFVVHRGVRVCQSGSVSDRVVCLLMTCSQGCYKAAFGSCCLLDHSAYILISSQQALTCLVHLKERERESPKHSFKPTVLGSCSACWIVQCMCRWLVDRCVRFVFCLSDRSVYVLVTC